MIFSWLHRPEKKAVALVATVLASLALGQIVWDHRIEVPHQTAQAQSTEPRQMVIADAIGLAPPPPPTLKFDVPADPFRQLDQIGLDGYSLRQTAKSMGVDITRVSTLDLTGINIDGIDRNDRKCLTQAIYYEARNQDVSGQMAVADVVLNRVASRHYPNSICGVVYQGSERKTGCQFTFACDGSLDRPIERKAMVRSQILATAILGGFRLPLTDDALNYHAGYVSPYWAPTLSETAKIGDHIFYKPVTGRGPAKLEKTALNSG